MKTSQPYRRRRSSSEWALLVEKSKTSSLPLPAFCEQANVSLSQLYAWRQKLRAKSPPPGGGFTPVRLGAAAPPAAPSSAGSIEVQLNNGRVVRVVGEVDMRTLRAVILVAEAGVSC